MVLRVYVMGFFFAVILIHVLHSPPICLVFHASSARNDILDNCIFLQIET